MTQTHKAGFIAALLAFVSIAFVGIAYANPSVFSAGVTTNNAASTTPAWLLAGISTSTTPVYDTNAQTSQGNVAYKADSAGLLIQFAGSSTASVLTAKVEYSQDCIDYYQNYVLDARTISTSSIPYILGAPFTTQMKFASTTLNGVAITNAGTATDTAALVIPTPFRCTRVVFSVLGGNAAVWGQIVPIKERP